jgi:hypothetical protein
MVSADKKNETSWLISLMAAVAAGATTIAWTLSQRSQKSPPSSSVTILSELAKSRVLELRKKYFSKAVSVSYANTNPLMIVGVSENLSKICTDDAISFPYSTLTYYLTPFYYFLAVLLLE